MSLEFLEVLESRVRDAAERIEELATENAALKKEIEKLERDKSARGGLKEAVQALLAKKVEGAKGSWVVGQLPLADPGALREAADEVRTALGSGAAAPHAPHDVRLEAVVDDCDQRAVLIRPPDVRDRARRDLSDEVLVFPARNGLRRRDRPRAGRGFRSRS